MSTCFLKGYGKCGGGISREHYISETVLAVISNGKRSVPIGGLFWQSEDTLQNIGLSALQSKMLCESHNSGLSNLDSTAGALFRVLNSIDKNPRNTSDHHLFKGEEIELWLLKVLCGLSYSSNLNNSTLKPECRQILEEGKWPDSWGLYLPTPDSSLILNNEFYLSTKVNPNTQEILLASYSIAGVLFTLVLGKPDDPSAFGSYRPRGLIFDLGESEKRVEFEWLELNNRAITYKKVGSTKELPAHQLGWKNSSLAGR